MPKYAVTVIKRIAYVDTVIVEAENKDDAHDIALDAAKALFSNYQRTPDDTDYEVGSVVSISA